METLNDLVIATNEFIRFMWVKSEVVEQLPDWWTVHRKILNLLREWGEEHEREFRGIINTQRERAGLPATNATVPVLTMWDVFWYHSTKELHLSFTYMNGDEQVNICLVPMVCEVKEVQKAGGTESCQCLTSIRLAVPTDEPVRILDIALQSEKLAGDKLGTDSIVERWRRGTSTYKDNNPICPRCQGTVKMSSGTVYCDDCDWESHWRYECSSDFTLTKFFDRELKYIRKVEGFDKYQEQSLYELQVAITKMIQDFQHRPKINAEMDNEYYHKLVRILDKAKEELKQTN